MSSIEEDFRKSLKYIYDDLLEAENKQEKDPSGFKNRLQVIHENLQDQEMKICAHFGLGDFGVLPDFEPEYLRRGDAGMDQMIKSQIKLLAVEVGLDLEQGNTTTDTSSRVMDEVIEPFKLAALERFSKIIGDSFSGSQITELFRKSGYPEIVHDGSTKWRFLSSTFENLQKRKFGSYVILKFLETVCDPQEYFERPEYHMDILYKLNEVLSFYGMNINEKGKVIKIKEKHYTISSKNDSKSTPDETIVGINISPKQGYAGDSIVLEAWVSKPDTAVHLDIIDENGKRRMNTGQVVFTNPFKHVLTLSKHSLRPGKYTAMFYTTNNQKNIPGTFEFLTSEANLETITENISENKPISLINDKKWDVFISHASEDKETVAKPFAEKLRSMGLKVWYDEFSLKWGKSLRKSIDEGLSNSSFGIVILSKVFFQKTWTKMELDGLTTIMTTTGQDNILPLRFRISNEDVAKVSPTLAGIFSRSWDEGIEKLSNEVQELVNENKKKF